MCLLLARTYMFAKAIKQGPQPTVKHAAWLAEHPALPCRPHLSLYDARALHIGVVVEVRLTWRHLKADRAERATSTACCSMLLHAYAAFSCSNRQVCLLPCMHRARLAKHSMSRHLAVVDHQHMWHMFLGVLAGELVANTMLCNRCYTCKWSALSASAYKPVADCLFETAG
jgi:hypothetical protein